MKYWQKRFFGMLLTLIFFMFSGCGKADLFHAETPDANLDSGNGKELSELTVTVLDIGKADAILIETEQSTVLIDSGEEENGDEVCAALKQKGIDRLDYMILTHLDKDHIGGAAQVLNTVSVEHVIQSANDETSDEYDALKQACHTAGIVPKKLETEETFWLDDAEFRLLPAQEKIYEDDNDYSIMIELTYGAKRFLFAGDAVERRIGEYLQEGASQFDFFKVPHHGKLENLSEALIYAVNPRYAVITCSKKNPPDDEVVALLKESGAQVFLTEEGTVVARCNGESLIVEYAPS